jgi:hypothetical protein
LFREKFHAREFMMTAIVVGFPAGTAPHPVTQYLSRELAAESCVRIFNLSNRWELGEACGAAA